MRRLIFILIILTASIFIGLEIAKDPGYAVFAYQKWTVEMPLWCVVLGFFLLLLILFFILRFFDAIDATWVSWKNWLRLRRKHKSYSKTNRGLINLIEGNWKNAENQLMQGVDQSGAPLINFLAAAKAAHEQRAYERRDTYLRKAYDLSPETHMAVGLIQAQLQLKQGKTEQVFAMLNQLRKQMPKQALVLKLLERVCVQLGDWDTLLKLVPDLRKANLISLDQMILLQVRIYKELIQKTSQLNALHELWKNVPKKLRNQAALADSYVTQLLRYPDTISEAEECIVRALKETWDAGLVKLYGTLPAKDPVKQLKTAETWQKHNESQAILFLTLARLSMRCQLWGKARQYYENVLKLEDLPEAYYEYGNLLTQLDETNSALQLYREGLKKLI